MSDYTPDTERVRNGYTYYGDDGAEFDRWLASVKAQAWYEGVRAAFSESIEFDGWVPYELKNPYREEQ